MKCNHRAEELSRWNMHWNTTLTILHIKSCHQIFALPQKTPELCILIENWTWESLREGSQGWEYWFPAFILTMQEENQWWAWNLTLLSPNLLSCTSCLTVAGLARWTENADSDGGIVLIKRHWLANPFHFSLLPALLVNSWVWLVFCVFFFLLQFLFCYRVLCLLHIPKISG